MLQNKSPGAFLVRKSSSKPGCYALTLRVPSPPGPNIANYIILRSPRGYKIKVGAEMIMVELETFKIGFIDLFLKRKRFNRLKIEKVPSLVLKTI